MNKAQKRVVLLGVVIAIAMLLFPPWQRMSSGYRSSRPGGPYSSPSATVAGYGFLFYPPRGAESVDLSRLAVQFALVAVVAFGACVALSRKSGD